MAAQIRQRTGRPAATRLVRAQQFQIEDEYGNVRGTFGCADNGAPSLCLHDSNGMLRLWIVLNDDRPGIEYLDAAGKDRLLIYLPSNSGGNAEMVFSDVDGSPKLALTATKEGALMLKARTL